MELAWGLYRSHLDNALKHARQEIIEDEGKRIITYSHYVSVCTKAYIFKITGFPPSISVASSDLEEAKFKWSSRSDSTKSY